MEEVEKQPIKLPRMTKAKEPVAVVKPKITVRGLIVGFVIGLLVEGIVVFLLAKPFYPKTAWAMQHPEEMKWAMDRYEAIQKASKVLYFDNTFGTK